MKDRLTEYYDGEVREDHSRDTSKWKNGNRECMKRLAAYEDTGMSPEEAMAMKDENKRLHTSLRGKDMTIQALISAALERAGYNEQT